MDSGRDRMRMNIEGDRLSGLPDDLILKILSFVGLKDAIGTCVLSSRWRCVWTSIPHLSFSSDDFRTMDKFFDFVTHVLSRRNNQAPLSSFKLYASGMDGCGAARIINHAFSLNAQQVNIAFMSQFVPWLFNHKHTGYPLSFSSSPTHPKHLTLTWRSLSDYAILTSTRELSYLTTLSLNFITLHDGFLSMCPNLESLTLNCCKMTGSNALRISHPRLSNLKLEEAGTVFRVDVVTPQLKSLTILKSHGYYGISAPKLASLLIRGECPSMFSAEAFDFLEEAQLSFYHLRSKDAPTIICIIQKFPNVKLLSLTRDYSVCFLEYNFLQLLNASLRLISRQPSPLVNLKTLKILPKLYCFLMHTYKFTRVIVSTEVKNYLLSGSSKATLTEELHEQCCDVAASGDLDFLLML